MESRATRRIKGRGGVNDPNRGFRKPPERRDANFLTLLLVSLALHALVLAAVVYFPHHSEKTERVELISVTMSPMPGPAGGGGKSPDTVVPRKKAKKEPPQEKEPVKLASKQVETRPPSPREKEPEPVPVVPEAPRGPGQGPAGGGVKGATIGPVTLEGEFNPALASYVATIQRNVENRWEPPVLWKNIKPRSVVFFRIDRSGRITDVVIENGSGMELYDQKAVLAVKKATLPPLPAGYKGDMLGVHYTFIPQE